jgi:hypothetical protein
MCAIVLLFQGVGDPLASKQKKKRKKERSNYVLSYQVLSKVLPVPKTPLSLSLSLSLSLMPS